MLSLSKSQRVRALMDAHVQFVGRCLRNMGVFERDVDDAIQQTFIVAAKRIDDIQVGAEKTFLFQTALRVASHARRSEARRSMLLEARERENSEPVATPEEIVGRRSQRALLDQALDALDERVRPVFVLYEIEELTTTEVAEALGLPQGTVASRLRRARKMFRERVHELASRSVARSA